MPRIPGAREESGDTALQIVMTVEPELPEYPGHTAAFGRIMRTAYEGQTTVRSMAPLVIDLIKVRDEELVLLHQVRIQSKIMVWQETIAAEIARRNYAATVESIQAIRDLQTSVDTCT
jgi:hypothetical protein